MTERSFPEIVKLEQALHEASIYGIGATSDVNQRVILNAAKHLRAALRSSDAATIPPHGDWYDGYCKGVRDATKDK